MEAGARDGILATQEMTIDGLPFDHVGGGVLTWLSFGHDNRITTNCRVFICATICIWYSYIIILVLICSGDAITDQFRLFVSFQRWKTVNPSASILQIELAPSLHLILFFRILNPLIHHTTAYIYPICEDCDRLSYCSNSYPGILFTEAKFKLSHYFNMLSMWY